MIVAAPLSLHLQVAACCDPQDTLAASLQVQCTPTHFSGSFSSQDAQHCIALLRCIRIGGLHH
jgi:hypothetical protein